MLLKTLTHWMPLRFQLLVFLTLIFCLGYIANNHAFASEPTTRIYGYFESGITDQYLVAVEVCAGSEKFEIGRAHV